MIGAALATHAESISVRADALTSASDVDPADATLLESLLSGAGTSSPAVLIETGGATTGESAGDVDGHAGDTRFKWAPRTPVFRSLPPAPAAAPARPMGADERMQLINGCQGIVRSLAWKIHRKLPQNIDLDDLIAYGQVGLAQAARDFDPGVGGKFTTYAYWRVRGAILDGLSQMSWFKRQDFHASKYEPQRQVAVETETSTPDVGPLKKSAERAPDAVLSEEPKRLKISSIGSESPSEADFTGAGSVEDVSTKAPPTQSMMREMMEHVRKSIELLPPESASLIRAAYFEGVTLHEAGRRLGISRAWTSRLHAKALEKLARELRSHWSAD